MGLVLFICIVALIVGVLGFVGAPLRGARKTSAEDAKESARASAATAARGEVETAREAKYREIRDAELDYRTGKLSDRDYAAIDADLRAEAVSILDALERAEEASRRSAE